MVWFPNGTKQELLRYSIFEVFYLFHEIMSSTLKASNKCHLYFYF